jgi:lysophospholipase L1-like esterase
MKKLLLFISLFFCVPSFSQFGLLQATFTKLSIDLTGAKLICDGNSLTKGDHASNELTTSYPAILQGLVNSYGATVYNKGVNGQTTQQMEADAATDIYPLFASGVENILIPYEGGNDFYFNNIDATTTYNHLVTYCNNARAAAIAAGKRLKIIIVTIPYRDAQFVNSGYSSSGKSDADYNTQRLAVNALIMANFPTFADGVFDIASHSGFTQSTFLTGGYYYLDRIHQNDAGYSYFANQLLPVITGL